MSAALLSAAQPAAGRALLVRYLAIAIVTAVLSTLALAAPSILVGLAVLVAPFLLVGFATDADPLDLVPDDPDPFGPERRALPTV